MISWIRDFFRNPFTIWINWFLHKSYLEFKFRENKLKIGFMAKIERCNFGYSNTLFEHSSLYDVSIGDYSYVGRLNRLMHVDIGKFTCIGSEVLAGLGKHPTKHYVSIHPAFYSPIPWAQISFVKKLIFKEFERIKIGHDVWVGARAIILDGVSIGNGAIIAAGAVVTKDVPPYAIVGGVPAQILRYRFDSDKIAWLESIQWWNRDIEWIKRNADDFVDIEKLMQVDAN